MLKVLRQTTASSPAFALAVIVCALLMRVLVPQGWMPVETAQGWRITLCSGTGPMRMVMPGHAAAIGASAHHSSDEQHQDGNDHPCAFSGVALALDQPALPMLDVPATAIAALVATAAPAVAIGRGLAAPPPPSTGPPALP